MGDLDMTTLTIRKVDASLRELLRVRAARNGRSMEAELRAILADTLTVDRDVRPNLAEAVQRRFAPFGGVELKLPPRTAVRPPPSFE